MTPIEAWRIISANMMELYKKRRADNPNFKGYTDIEIEAEVICFKALEEMERRHSSGTEAELDS